MPKFMTTAIPVQLVKEGKLYVFHTPALKLAAQGKNVAEAQKNFREVLRIFFEETAEHGTLDKALEELGWVKKAHGWIPPKPKREIIENKVENIHIPISA